MHTSFYQLWKWATVFGENPHRDNMQGEQAAKPRTVLMWCHSANHCTTIPSILVVFFVMCHQLGMGVKKTKQKKLQLNSIKRNSWNSQKWAVCWPRLNIPAKNASAFNHHSKYLNHIIKKLNLNVFTIKCVVFCTVDFTYAVPLLGECS